MRKWVKPAKTIKSGQEDGASVESNQVEKTCKLSKSNGDSASMDRKHVEELSKPSRHSNGDGTSMDTKTSRHSHGEEMEKTKSSRHSHGHEMEKTKSSRHSHGDISSLGSSQFEPSSRLLRTRTAQQTTIAATDLPTFADKEVRGSPL